MTEQLLYGPDGGPRKPARFSQCEKILAVLADGDAHLVSEIHERAGYSRLNSRVSELRKRGYVIECFHVPGENGSRGYGYRLCPEGPSAPPLATAGSDTEPGAADHPSSASSGQLSLGVAA